MSKDARTGSQSARVEIGVEQLARLSERLSREHALPLSSYRNNCIQRRLSTRIRSLGLYSLDQYLDLLDADPSEEKKLIDALTISVSSFFRDPETFSFLARKVVPEILAWSGKYDSRVNVWSAGCSTGEEAYSLAIIFCEASEEFRNKNRLRIWATDIDEEALALAREGFYRKDKMTNLSTAQIERYFITSGKGFKVRPELKSLVEFRKENILAPVFNGFEGLDMVICRNLLIYLEKNEQMRLLEKFERSLRQGGFLVLGKTEFLREQLRGSFEHISLSERIYRKSSRALSAGRAGGKR